MSQLRILSRDRIRGTLFMYYAILLNSLFSYGCVKRFEFELTIPFGEVFVGH
ncbi:MAG: hypothetical protein WA180_22810 [Candidatus Sulfotelmatobacter sp.]